MPGIVNLDVGSRQRSLTGFWRASSLTLDQHVRHNPLGMANPAGPGPPTGDTVAAVYRNSSSRHDGACERRDSAAMEHLLNRFVREEGTQLTPPAPIIKLHPVEGSIYDTASMTSTCVTGSASAPPSTAGSFSVKRPDSRSASPRPGERPDRPRLRLRRPGCLDAVDSLKKGFPFLCAFEWETFVSYRFLFLVLLTPPHRNKFPNLYLPLWIPACTGMTAILVAADVLSALRSGQLARTRHSELADTP